MLVEPLPLPFDSGPILPPRCHVCGCWKDVVHPRGQRYTYAMRRQHWVKIGMTGNPRERLGVLSRSSPGCLVRFPDAMDLSAPLALVALVAGDVEHELHDRFAPDHVVGEWFHPGAGIADWIARHRTSQ